MKMKIRTQTDYIIIHCSATPPSMDIGAEEIDRWHRARNYFMCGYHFVIRRDGTIESAEGGHKCRPLDVMGAHVRGYNHNSIGICLVGGVSEKDAKTPENNFTIEQFTSLRALLDKLDKKYHAWVCGHSDIPGVNKACPSFNVREWLESQIGRQVCPTCNRPL